MRTKLDFSLFFYRALRPACIKRD